MQNEPIQRIKRIDIKEKNSFNLINLMIKSHMETFPKGGIPNENEI